MECRTRARLRISALIAHLFLAVLLRVLSTTRERKALKSTELISAHRDSYRNGKFPEQEVQEEAE